GDLRKLFGPLDLDRQLRQRAEGCAVVELLERLSSAVLERYLTDEEDQGGRVLKRRVDAGGSMRRSRRPRHETDARPSGQLAVGLGHVRRPGLVPGDDQTDGRVPQSIEDGDVTLARNAKRGVDAVNDQLVDEDPRAATTHSPSGSSKKTLPR